MDKLLGRVNRPMKSKINWVNVTAGLTALAVNLGLTDAETAATINKTLLAIMPVLNFVLRTFFTVR